MLAHLKIRARSGEHDDGSGAHEGKEPTCRDRPRFMSALMTAKRVGSRIWGSVLSWDSALPCTRGHLSAPVSTSHSSQHLSAQQTKVSELIQAQPCATTAEINTLS